MTSLREAALLALLARVKAAVAVPPLAPGIPRPAPVVVRNEQRAPTLTAPGLVCLFDGELVDEQPILSPLGYIVTWRADVEVHFAAKDADARAVGLDALVGQISTALAADRLLGGAVEWLDVGAAQLQEAENDVAAALVPVEMQWTSYGTPNA